MEKKHDLIFCPQCGVKLEGNEFICSTCRYKLAEQSAYKQEPPAIPPPVNNTVPPPPPPPPPKITTPVNPPVNQYVPPVQQQNIYQQPQQPYYPQQPMRKKGMGAGLWILIIFLIIIVLGGGTVGVLQYTGTINIEMLNNIIPAKESNNQTPAVVNHTRYYVVHSFAILGSKWNAIVSGIVVSRKPFNNEEGAKNQFKKAIMAKYPNDYNNFLNNTICNQYKSLPEAQKAHSSLVKSYGKNNYDIRTVNFGY